MRLVFLLLMVLSAAPRAADSPQKAEYPFFAHPELTRPGACVIYREGGSGWIITDPVYWLKGTTLAAETRKRRTGLCPDAQGKPVDRFSREEFIRLAQMQPCVSDPAKTREIDVLVVRLRIDDWETPWNTRAANAGRLFRGHFLDQKLETGGQIEIDAELLGVCS